MRDQRFVAEHRGGPLDQGRHRLLAEWAADCAGHVLPLLELHSSDSRCVEALELGRSWARGEVRVGPAQQAAVACHALARALADPAAVAVARAAGHAVATAHCADHALGAAAYALKAVAAASQSPEEERAWQVARLPDAIRELVVSAFDRKFPSR